MNKSWSCWLDRAYCASPSCRNECGRKMSNEQKKELEKIKHARITYAYFCGKPKNVIS